MTVDERRLGCIMGIATSPQVRPTEHAVTTAPRANHPDFSKLFSGKAND